LRPTSFRDYVAGKTLKTRRRLVELLAPKIAWSLQQQQTMENYVIRTPRPMILFAKKHFAGRQDLRGIEIGVEKAVNALSILKELPIEKLFLIDPYVPYEDELGHADCSVDYTIAHTTLAEYPQVVWLRKTSETAIREFQNEEPFDFIYIDGNHTFEFVKKDITLYYPLIRNNGLIGGHDYTPYYESVMRAVNEFAEQTELELHSVFPDWWFIVKHAIKIESRSVQELLYGKTEEPSHTKP
jgi:hypothetical protein